MKNKNLISNATLPRFIRLRDAPNFFGMCKNRFNSEVRPFLTEIPIGVQGIAFDRLDMDAFADEYKSRNGRSGQPKGDHLWNAKQQDLGIVTASGTFKNRYSDKRFMKALEQATSKKRS